MVGIYLSGTGNTKHCIDKLIQEQVRNIITDWQDMDNRLVAK